MHLKFIGKLKEIFFPLSYTCDICGIETFSGNLCNECLKTVKFNDKVTCPVCGRKTVRPEICLECKAKAPRFKKAVSPLVYEGGAIVLVHKFKNGGGYLKDYFADLISGKLADFPPFDAMVCVPMTRKAVRRRGYNQDELIARKLSRKLNIPVINGVVKVKETKAQKGLSSKQRAENLKGCFKVKDKAKFKDKDILVVDDVLTTGSTADEMCKTLLAAGAKHVYLATVASVEYKQTPKKNLKLKTGIKLKPANKNNNLKNKRQSEKHGSVA